MAERDEEMIARLQRAYEAFNRGDFDAAMEGVHPEAEFVPPSGQASLRDAAAVRAWMEPDAFASQDFEPLDFRVEGNKVLVRQRVRARGAASGIEMEIYVWVVLTLNDDGLVTRVENYLDHEKAEALEAAGLSE
jgi:ketosteroid isomerase-like protein